MLVILNKDEYDNLNKKGNGGCCGIIILLIIIVIVACMMATTDEAKDKADKEKTEASSNSSKNTPNPQEMKMEHPTPNKTDAVEKGTKAINKSPAAKQSVTQSAATVTSTHKQIAKDTQQLTNTQEQNQDIMDTLSKKEIRQLQRVIRKAERQQRKKK